MDDTCRALLIKGAEELGLHLESEAIDGFGCYMDLLLEWSQRMNLTAIKKPQEIVVKHFLDSLSLLTQAGLPQGAKIADVGTGAGFPGIPLKLVRPDLKLTCMDSLGKRITFLQTLSKELSIECECVHIRAEEAGRKAEYRGAFDGVTARAVANLRVLAEFCLPLLKTGGAFYAMKGPDGRAEANEARNAAVRLGGEIEAIREFQLPEGELPRSIIILRKKSETPDSYPRIFAKIQKNPL